MKRSGMDGLYNSRHEESLFEWGRYNTQRFPKEMAFPMRASQEPVKLTEEGKEDWYSLNNII